jgi:hypothetical protein
MSTNLARKPLRRSEEKIGDVEQLKRTLRQLLKQYLEGKLDIAQVAEKIVDSLYPWETHYAPLLAYHRDPWAERADDILTVSEMISTCEDVVFSEGWSDEEFIQCVLDYILSRRGP